MANCYTCRKEFKEKDKFIYINQGDMRIPLYTTPGQPEIFPFPGVVDDAIQFHLECFVSMAGLELMKELDVRQVARKDRERKILQQPPIASGSLTMQYAPHNKGKIDVGKFYYDSHLTSKKLSAVQYFLEKERVTEICSSCQYIKGLCKCEGAK